jgi:hypothetical protein
MVFLAFAILFATKHEASMAAAFFCWQDPQLSSLVFFTISAFHLKNSALRS